MQFHEFAPHELSWAARDEKSVSKFGADPSTWEASDVREAICRVRGIPLVEIETEHVDPVAFKSLIQTCRRYRFLPTYSHEMVLVVAMVNPWDEAVLVRIRQVTHQEVRVVGISETAYNRVLAHATEVMFRREQEEKEARGKVVARVVERPISWPLRTKPARAVVEDLVQLSADLGASDILLTPGEHWLDVRIKASGKTEVLPPIERRFAQPFLRAFKEMAGMSVRETKGIQKGKADMSIAGKGEYELRIETAPMVYGESLVARLQNRREQLDRMLRLPFTGKNLEIVTAALKQKQGFFVTTGPVNSGKSTLLYSCLRQIDPNTHNIRTLEDPPEINLPWTGQIPVDDKTDVNFQAGLKSLLRQSPDVILLGEIRSPEVCGTAIEAVFTGHLVFATIHATDAVGVVPRLLDLGVSGHKIAGALLLVVGQRLVPRLCPDCRSKVSVTDEIAKHFELHNVPVPPHIYEPVGCPLCDNTGIRGRVPLFELVCPNDEMRETIAAASDEHFDRAKLVQQWRAAGGAPLGSHAMQRVAAGEIDYAEAQKHDPMAFQRLVGGPGH